MKRAFVLIINLTLVLLTLSSCFLERDPSGKIIFNLFDEIKNEPAVLPVGKEKEANIEVSLSNWFPSEHIELPLKCKVVGVYNDFEYKDDNDWCLEISLLEINMTKSKAVEYFSQQLTSNEVTSFSDSGDKTEYIPLEILAEYPETSSYVELFARYPYPSSGIFISSIKIMLFTTDDREKLVITRIEVGYTGKPSDELIIPYIPEEEPLEEKGVEVKYRKFKKKAKEAGYMVFDDASFGKSSKYEVLGCFDLRRPEGERFTIREYDTEENAQAFINEKLDASYSYICHGRFVAVYLSWYSTKYEGPLISFIEEMFIEAQDG